LSVNSTEVRAISVKMYCILAAIGSRKI